MIRRPPTSIPLKQDDVDEVEALLAVRRQLREAADENETMDVEEQQSSKGKGKSKTGGGGATTKSKGKGKQRAPEQNADDSLVQAEEEARLAREAQSREQRIGL